MRTLTSLFPFLFFLVSCLSTNIDSEKNDGNIKSEEIVSNIEVITYQNDTLGWGFKILRSKKIIIDQPIIPVQGIRAFNSQADSRKVGELMVQKIKNNIFPPSVSLKELDSLGIVY